MANLSGRRRSAVLQALSLRRRLHAAVGVYQVLFVLSEPNVREKRARREAQDDPLEQVGREGRRQEAGHRHAEDVCRQRQVFGWYAEPICRRCVPGEPVSDDGWHCWPECHLAHGARAVPAGARG